MIQKDQLLLCCLKHRYDCGINHGRFTTHDMLEENYESILAYCSFPSINEFLTMAEIFCIGNKMTLRIGKWKSY